MNKLYFNKTLILTLITAFIFLQWSATHIHLSTEHKHDGDHHQHAATAHQHQIDNHHTDNIDPEADLLSHTDNSKVVELEQVCTQFHGKLGQQLAIIQTTSWSIAGLPLFAVQLSKPYQAEDFQSYYQYSSIRLRAPPLFS